MIRRWFHAAANGKARKQSTTGPVAFGQFEQLEDKRCLAFIGFFDGITLDLVQTIDDGDVVVDNSGVGGAFRVTDNAASLTFVDAQNVSVTMLDNTANQLNFRINSSHTGDVTLNLGDGPRDVIFDGNGFPGIANTVGGDMAVFAGDGPQFIQLAPQVLIPIPYQSVGSSTFDLGDGFDTVYNNENFVIVGGDLNLTGVNLFQYTDFLFPVPLDADLKVGGDLNMDTSNESTESFLVEGGTWHDPDPDAEERSIIRGDFNYIGGDDIDHVFLNDTYIQGNMTIDLGEGIPFFGDPQNVTTTLTFPRPIGPYFEIDGDISITAGDSNLGNVIVLDGYSNGNLATFDMGGLEDDITYRLLGVPLDVSANMGDGVDTFSLFTNVNTLAIDFGNDLGDTFVNEFGFFGFDADYTNYHFFDFFYTAGDDRMVMNQLIDTGDIIIDNNGGPATGIDWQLFTELGGEAPTNHAETLVVNMLSNTGNQVSMDLDNPVIAFITLNLGDGDRLVEFVGESNNPLRDITINADLGNQHIELSVNAALAVATLEIDLGMGNDTVDDDANNLNLSEDLVFRGVNLFENDGFLSVGRNVFIDTLSEMQENIFATNGQMFVAGNFTYDGGDGRDELRLNGSGGTSISGNVSIDLGDNLFGGTQYALLNSNPVFVGGALTVLSDNGNSPDVFDTDPGSTSVSGNIFVDLGDGPNTAEIAGGFGGSNITYNGGDGVDLVTFGTMGNAATFNASLFDGDDVFTLLAGADIASPFVVNFGNDNDTFINQYGPFDFDADLLGLNGFNHFFDLTNSKLTSTQISDQGPVIVDNNGTAGAIRFTTGSTSEIAAVDDLEINMLGGSLSTLEIDFDSPFAGTLEANLNSGPRTVNFTGDANEIGGDLTVDAGSGNQQVNLAVNSGLLVVGQAIIDLGLDFDTLTDGGQDVEVGGNYLLTGINSYVTTGVLTVAGNLTVNNGSDNSGSLFQELGVVQIVGDFAYLGDGLDDTVLLNAGAAIIGGNINLSLGQGNNTAILAGVFAGTSVSFTSGSGIDLFDFGMLGPAATLFAELGSGDDTFILAPGVAVSSMTVDFGNDDDTFVNGYGPFDFPANLIGLDGFSHAYNPLTQTLISVQSRAVGPVVVDTNGVGDAVRVITSSTTELGPVSNIVITMLNGSGDDLSVDLDTPLAGDLSLNLGGGVRTLSLTGDSNTVGGNLVVGGGSEGQTVNAALNAPLLVGLDATFNLGLGTDSLALAGNDLTVGGELTLLGVNQFENNATVLVAGGLLVDNSAESTASSLIDNAMIDIAGDFHYLGGDGNDVIRLNAASSIGGDIDIKAGAGNNTAVILGNLGGSDLKYNGRDGIDRVTVGTTGGPANVNARLGLGNDTFVLNAGAAVGPTLRVDFGGGDDTFTSAYGNFNFNAQLLNLDGYNAIFDLGTGNLDVTQIADTGNVTLDNNGLNQAIRFGVGTMNEITPANDLRLILMDGTSTHVTADFDGLRDGNTVLQLRNGNRNVNFTGESNTFMGLLRIEAGDGVQTLSISDEADLNVDGTLIFNGRDGSDRLVAENGIHVSGAMLLRGVNTFVNDAGVDVGGDFNMITSLENEATKLISNTPFLVGGNLTYIGGGGVDAINFKSTGASIGGFTYIDIATSSDPASNQRISLTGGFSTTNLVVEGGMAAAGNFFTTDSATQVGNQVIVNFAASTTDNTAIFNGSYGGDYGTYRGGSAGDYVVFGAAAPGMLFAALTAAGDDTFTIAPGADLDFLYVDFGAGNDFLENQLGDPLPFPSNVFNN